MLSTEEDLDYAEAITRFNQEMTRLKRLKRLSRKYLSSACSITCSDLASNSEDRSAVWPTVREGDEVVGINSDSQPFCP